MTDQETRVPAQGCEDTSATCGAGGRREFLGAAVAAVASRHPLTDAMMPHFMDS